MVIANRRLLLVLLVLATVAMVSPPAVADDFPAHEPYLGAFAGKAFHLRAWDLGKHAREGTLSGQDAVVLGLRGGFQLTSQLAIEGAAAWDGVDTQTGDRNNAWDIDVTALYHVLPGRWSPFASAGLGLVVATGAPLGGDTDPTLQLGGGVRALISPRVAVRLDLRDVITDGFDNAGAHNLELTVGIDVFALRKLAPADRDHDGIANKDDTCPDQPGTLATGGCPDQDGDGIADSDDRCPAVAGVQALAGCPDQDGDGVTDADDKCPDQAGTAALNGCPDKDGDSIADGDDKCPDQAGTAALNGCPDQDGDGVTDADDKCPDQAGTAALNGCPDRDGDGVADGDDKCPDEPGKPALAGCPDRDNDGVPDGEDKCPDVTGLPDHDGCVPAAVQKFTGAIKGINFDSGKTTIRPSSDRKLNQAVTLMKDYPTLRIRIVGHTDSKGAEEDNMVLSQGRADAVKAYLVGKGIDASRIETQGMGETAPIQSNKTAAGRAANRRIEFTVLGQ